MWWVREYFYHDHESFDTQNMKLPRAGTLRDVSVVCFFQRVNRLLWCVYNIKTSRIDDREKVQTRNMLNVVPTRLEIHNKNEEDFCWFFKCFFLLQLSHGITLLVVFSFFNSITVHSFNILVCNFFLSFQQPCYIHLTKEKNHIYIFIF